MANDVSTDQDELEATRPTGGMRPHGGLDLRLLASLMIVSGMVAGLTVPHLAEMVGPLVMPALFALAVASLTPARGELHHFLGRIDAGVAGGVAWTQMALPMIVIVVCTAIGLPGDIIALFLVSATASIVFAAPAIAQIIGIRRSGVTHMVIATTLFMPVSLLLFLSPFLPLGSGDVLLTYAERVAIFLAAPLAVVWLIGRATREMSDGRKRRRAVTVDHRIDHAAQWTSIAALPVFAIGIFDGVAETFTLHPARIGAMLAGIVLLSVLMYVTTRLALPASGADRGELLGMFAVQRNVGLSYAVVGHMFGPELAVYVALCQIPTLCLPLLLRIVSPAAARAEPARYAPIV